MSDLSWKNPLRKARKLKVSCELIQRTNNYNYNKLNSFKPYRR